MRKKIWCLETRLGKQVMRSWAGPGNKAIPKVYGAFLVVLYCAEKIVSVWFWTRCCAHDIARLGCKRDMVGTGIEGQFLPWLH